MNKNVKFVSIFLILALGIASLTQMDFSSKSTSEKKDSSSTSVLSTSDSVVATTDEMVNSEERFQEGVHYTKVEGISVPEGITEPYVIEYFWMGCSHCQNLEPIISTFTERQNITLFKKAAPLKERWILDAKVYYALMETGNSEHFDDLFQLYMDMGKEMKLPMKDDLMGFLTSKGIDTKMFEEAMMSESIKQTLYQTSEEMIKNKLSGVPKLVINGKYLATPNEDIKTNRDYMELVKFLTEKK